MFGTAQTAEELATIVTIEEETIELWKKSGFGRRLVRRALNRVNRGSMLLDEKKPDWVYGVLPEKLDMSCASLCIIGQAYGNYEAVAVPFGMKELEDDDYSELTEREQTKLEKLAISNGFLTLHGFQGKFDVPYGLLDRVWVYMLTERHNRGGERVLLAMPEQN